MKRLVLHATDTAQWQALVHEAEAAAECSLSVETESYLVFTLMRFVGRARLAKTCLAAVYGSVSGPRATGRSAARVLRGSR